MGYLAFCPLFFNFSPVFCKGPKFVINKSKSFILKYLTDKGARTLRGKKALKKKKKKGPFILDLKKVCFETPDLEMVFLSHD